MEKKLKEIKERYKSTLLTAEQAGEYLGISGSDLTELADMGEIECLHMKNGIMFKALAVISFELGEVTGGNKTDSEEYNGMKATKGSIYKINNKTHPLEMCFAVTFGNGDKKRFKVRGRTPEELEEKKRAKMAELEDECGGKKSGDRTRTLREVCGEYFEHTIESRIKYNGKGTSYSNIEGIKLALDRICREGGDCDIREIDTTKVNDIIAELSKARENENGKEKYMSASYIKKIRDNFLNVMKYALTNGYTDKTIDTVIMNKELTTPDKNKMSYDVGTVRDILDAVSGNPKYDALINLMVYSGMRQEEALAVYASDFKQSGGKYYVHVGRAVVETGRNTYEVVGRLKHDEDPRMIEIPEKVYHKVMDYYRETQNDKRLNEAKKKNGNEELVFVTTTGKNIGKPVNKRTLYHSYTGYMERNLKGWDKGGLHRLRHTYASQMTEKLPLQDVADMLGHKDIRVTQQFYASLTEKKREAISESVNEMYEKISGRMQ